MKRNNIILIIGIIVAIMAILTPKVNAQNDSIPMKRIPVQFTLLFPLGTNGFNSYHYINHASFNFLVGYSGGVEGLELGGIANINRDNVIGAQGAGLFNITGGNVKGLQLAGIGNVNNGSAVGIVGSGVANFNRRSFTGLQLAGIANTSIEQFEGLQASGVTNVHVGDMRGVQLAGAVNVNTKTLSGAQIGVANYANEVKGTQIGVANVAGKISGFQLGLVNLADSIGKGAGFGLITYYGNGYHQFEVEANETFYVNATFKSGVEKLYMIYTVGIKPGGDKVFWSPGIGFGSLFHLSERLDMNMDLIARQVNEDEWWTSTNNMLNTFKLNFGYQLNSRFSVYGGPSLNVVVSSIKDSEGNVIGDSFSKRSFFDKTYENNRVRMYVGFSGGIRF